MKLVDSVTVVPRHDLINRFDGYTLTVYGEGTNAMDIRYIPSSPVGIPCDKDVIVTIKIELE